jgi:hypothetical protein
MARRKQPTATTPGEREQFWRRHLLAAEAKGGTLTKYAAAHRLKVGSLYEWRRILRRRGLLGESATDSTAAAFVPVISAPAPSAAKAPLPPACTVTLRNGVQLQFTGELEPAMLAEILAAASALS